MLGPGDVHRSRLIGAVDFNVPATRGEGAVLGGVGHELVQQQREARNDTPETVTSLPVIEKRLDVSCSW